MQKESNPREDNMGYRRQYLTGKRGQRYGQDDSVRMAGPQLCSMPSLRTAEFPLRCLYSSLDSGHQSLVYFSLDLPHSNLHLSGYKIFSCVLSWYSSYKDINHIWTGAHYNDLTLIWLHHLDTLIPNNPLSGPRCKDFKKMFWGTLFNIKTVHTEKWKSLSCSDSLWPQGL